MWPNAKEMMLLLRTPDGTKNKTRFEPPRYGYRASSFGEELALVTEHEQTTARRRRRRCVQEQEEEAAGVTEHEQTRADNG